MAKMNRERGLSNDDELASEFDSLLGRGRAENQAEESSSLNHMMNLEEEQRTMLRHHPQASSSRLPALDQHNDHSSYATTTAPVDDLSGSRFLPTDLGLVRVHLKDMVEKGKQSSLVTITTLDVYEADPWLLYHVHNDLFKRNEWYYFVPRIRRGEKAVKRTVPGIGESEGGTWRSNNRKKEIKDKDNNVKGYKQNLVYNKTVNGEPEKTDWLMTEYCLHEDTRDDLVLCHIRIKLEKEDKDITERSKNGRALTYEEKGKAKMVYEDEQQPSRMSSILKRNKSPIRFKAQRSSPQVALKSKGQMPQGEASTESANDLTRFANEIEKEMLQGEASTEAANDSSGFANRIEKEVIQGDHGDAIQQQEIPSLPPLQSNDNNIMMSSNQVQKEGEEAGLTGFANQTDTRMLGGEHGDATRQQQQITPTPSLPLLHDQDSEFETVMMTTQNNDYLKDFYFPSEEECMSFDIDELKNTEGDSTEQQPAFQDQDLGGSVG